MQAHNCDYTIVMPLYRKMYNLDVIEDILKGKRDPWEIFTNDENTIFMEVESSVTGGTKQINWQIPPPRNINQDIPGRFLWSQGHHPFVFKERWKYLGKIYHFESIKNLPIANAAGTILNIASWVHKGGLKS